METIKGCPHCGGPGVLTAAYSRKCRYLVFVKCDICGAQGKIYAVTADPATANWETDESAAAVTAWNMRTGKE